MSKAFHQSGGEPRFRELGAVEHATTGHASIALRVVADDNKRPVRCVGTAFVAGPGLAITAKHVVFDAFEALEYDPSELGGVLSRGGIKLYQVTFDCNYVIWDVFNIFAQSDTDLALLDIKVAGYTGKEPSGWYVPKLRLFPPPLTSPITAFGYHAGVLGTELDPDGVAKHINLDDKPILAKGRIVEIYDTRRDSVVCPFPCYQVDVRFHGGQSGGPVLSDRDGSICGAICTCLEDGTGGAAAASFASTLWPLLLAPVMKSRYSALRAIDQPMLIDLALNGELIKLRGLERLDLKLFPGREKAIRKLARKTSSISERLRSGRHGP